METENSNRISKTTVFVNRRFNGYYRYRNKFQIYPLQISLEGVANLHIPLIFEFTYDPLSIEYDSTKPKKVCVNEHEKKVIIEYLILLSVFTQYNFFIYENEQCWFFPLSSYHDSNKTKSIKGYNEYIKSFWGQKCFFGNFNNKFVQAVDNELSNVNLDKILKDKSNDYFNIYGKRLNTESVTFPEDIDLYFDEYFKCDDQKKIIFLSSASLFKSGLILRDQRSHLSLSFASFISSIETLSSYDYKGKTIQRCSECNQEKYQVTKKFKDFFKYYLKSDKRLEKYIDLIYSIRSKILHNGQLFLSDTANDNFSDIVELEHLIRLIRISLINWLMNNNVRIV